MKGRFFHLIILDILLISHFSACLTVKAPDPNESSKYPEAVREAADRVFIDGQLPPCVRDTLNLTRDEFEQKLGEFYNSNVSVKINWRAVLDCVTLYL